MLGELTVNQINNITEFLNDKLKRFDEENEWENFKAATEEVCKAETCPMIICHFYTKGGKENLATQRNAIHYFSSDLSF